MDVGPSDAAPIEGRQLITWAVLPGGTGVCLDLIGADGRTHRIALPLEALTGLLMTLPRMLQSALNARFSDGSLRIVHRLGLWQLEQAHGENAWTLKLGTTDGFEVAFAVNDEHARPLGAALLAAPHQINPSLTRRPH
jgi:hypothetical protein